MLRAGSPTAATERRINVCEYRCEIFAMVGATKRHNRIVGNILARLWEAARGGDCRVYSESVKLRVADDVIYYPDMMVACGPEGNDPVVDDDPCLIRLTKPRDG
jgi:Uma2 family endonuclease